MKAGRSLPHEAAQSFEETINSLSNPPDEATVEFGLTLKADSGIVITKVGAEANFKINLKWVRDKKQRC